MVSGKVWWNSNFNAEKVEYNTIIIFSKVITLTY